MPSSCGWLPPRSIRCPVLQARDQSLALPLATRPAILVRVGSHAAGRHRLKLANLRARSVNPAKFRDHPIAATPAAWRGLRPGRICSRECERTASPNARVRIDAPCLPEVSPDRGNVRRRIRQPVAYRHPLQLSLSG
jgi:hypothetical protein